MLIDAHAHLDRYDMVGPDQVGVALAEIKRERIFTISVSMDPAAYHRNLEIATMSPWVLPIFGVHPWTAQEHADRLDELDEAMERSPMFGEIGLDHHFVKESNQYPAQKTIFEHFMAAARDQNKMIEVHTKGAEQEVLDLFERYDIQRAVIHWYSGPMDVFERFVAQGCYFTMGLEAAHTAHVAQIARAIPTDRLLTETDNPGGPRAYVGGPGMPRLVKDVVKALASLRGVTADEIVGEVRANLLGIFRADPWVARRYVELVEPAQ